MATFLSSLLILIFCVLAGFHFYWLAGGEWGLDSVLPLADDQKKLKPPKIATLLVGIFLLGLAVLYFSASGFVYIRLPSWISTAFWVVPILFLIRSIGDFKYLGLFKKVKGTKFAEADNRLFVPLCLSISTVGFILVIFF